MNPIDFAWEELGIQEVPGDGDNPRIIEYHKETTLLAKDDEVPWCSAFVNWCCEQSSDDGTNLANARSWLTWGEHQIMPRTGDVCVLWRKSPTDWRGHVGFYIGGNFNYVALLGGNQSNKVCVREYPMKRVLGFRRRIERWK